MELPTELRNPKKGLINIKNKDDECFRWCHIRHLNPQTEHPERIKKEDKKMINELNYEEIEFPVSQKHYNKVEKQNSIRINVFGFENGQPFPIHISKETFEDQMNLLLITKDEKYCKAVIKKHFNKPLVMTEIDEQNFKTMDGCHICGEKYTDKDVRVRDHCHISGKFRGSAHQECNLKLRIKPEDIKIPVIFHNLRGYDSHFIMQQIGKIAKKHGYTNKKGEKQGLNTNAIPNKM